MLASPPLIHCWAVAILVWIAAAAAKDTSLRFYMHDNMTPPNQSVVMVAGPGTAGFGTVSVIDDPLTQGADASSPAIGRGQGTWIVASMDGRSLLLTFSAVFQTGDFKGSTLSFHGSDDTSEAVREIAVIGGTGQFRNARGYATIKTASASGGSVILEIDVKVSH
ncbi:hypothetical protein SELMODRAFT_184063 [Selaginella moellendorffii]|uniref:Dirigent protein n=1 Tax=Selaginella moellendorffii TaxID=88036 RepID=D8SZE9_SELML|nr:dirigent protein 2 [Selaginella moellendorffii]EFJ10201.1 hypothetical protein SELMODRAFT_184063 [Selaginella moellendorffii]|eukprot:XP_002988690.1 dirigent protein 2 [Selaginella moellendorffii]